MLWIPPIRPDHFGKKMKIKKSFWLTFFRPTTLNSILYTHAKPRDLSICGSFVYYMLDVSTIQWSHDIIYTQNLPLAHLWRHYDVIKLTNKTLERTNWMSIHVIRDYASKNKNQVKRFCKLFTSFSSFSRIIFYTRENHLICDIIIIVIIALTLILTKNITIFNFAMLWTMVIHQNNVPKRSLGPNKDVAFSEVWVRMSTNFTFLITSMMLLKFSSCSSFKIFQKSEKNCRKSVKKGVKKW